MSEHATGGVDDGSSPLPYLEVETTVDTERFWSELAAGRFVLPWCSRCDTWVWQPRPICPRCLEEADAERRWSGEGAVYSFSIVHRGTPGFDAGGPYVLSYVTLDDGPTVMSNIVGAGALDVAIGDRVRLVGPVENVKVGACRFELIAA